jgi:hypothetical protein
LLVAGEDFSVGSVSFFSGVAAEGVPALSEGFSSSVIVRT